LKRTLALIVAAMLAASILGCSASVKPVTQPGITETDLYMKASCATLHVEFSRHDQEARRLNDNLGNNKAKNAAKVLSFGILALADGDLSGDERRGARDAHIDHLEIINSAAESNECEGFPRDVLTHEELNDD